MTGESQIVAEAQALYARHVAERGTPQEFEALCAAHPRHANEFRRLDGEWKQWNSVFQQLAGSGSLSLAVERLTEGLEEEAEGNLPGSALLQRLRQRSAAAPRYTMLGEIGRGGMGAVVRVRDDDLRRTLAMKVILGREDTSREGDTPAVDRRTLGRFLEEAQITAQLEHPGIVPVHELGLGGDGRVYFTMRLVNGEDLHTIFKYVQEQTHDWTTTRALHALLKVCDAVTYAHDKGVVHRDLKPTNVMVGAYGEVYVMDWGLARVYGASTGTKSMTEVRTERNDLRDQHPDSPLVTLHGDVVGTPSYMAPEQARGDTNAIGPQGDVYAVGAMLYQLLSGRVPYLEPGARMPLRQVLEAVRAGPPKSLHKLAPQAPAELIAIADKAMQRDPSARYSNMHELSNDLRAWLEGRVVRAYETGSWAEARKWIARNRGLSAAVGGVVLSLAVGAVVATHLARKATDANTELKVRNTELDESRRLADQHASEALRLRDEALRALKLENEVKLRGLADDLQRFRSASRNLETAAALTHPAYQWWIESAKLLVNGRQENLSASVTELPGLAAARERLARVRAGAKPPVDARGALEEPDLVQLIERLELLERDLAAAEQSTTTPAAQAAWSTALAAIEANPRYRDQVWPNGRLGPQLGLLPLGENPATGLHEFVHVQTGSAPVRGEKGELLLTPESGLVFVLLPGGRVPFEDETGADYKLQAEHTPSVNLHPYFLSKYEVTAAQWSRIYAQPAPATNGLLPSGEHNWEDCRDYLERLLGWAWFPTLAQHEYAMRAGTKTPWWTGEDPSSMIGYANISDFAEDPKQLKLAPVGAYRPNPWGFHDMAGNLWEWCACVQETTVLPRDGDGLRESRYPTLGRVFRGGSFGYGALYSRSALSMQAIVSHRGHDMGLRPVLRITP